MSKYKCSPALLSPITRSHNRSSLDREYPEYIYRNAHSPISSLSVVQLWDPQLMTVRQFLWTGEQDGHICIYNLDTHHLIHRFNNDGTAAITTTEIHELESAPSSSIQPLQGILCIIDLGLGWVLTHDRLLGIRLWFWTLSTARPPPGIEGEVDPVLWQPELPRLMGVYSFDCGTFFLPSVVALPKDDDEVRTFLLLSPHTQEGQLSLIHLKIPLCKPTFEAEDVLPRPKISLIRQFEDKENQKAITQGKLHLIPNEDQCSTSLVLLAGLECGTVVLYKLLDDLNDDVLSLGLRPMWRLPLLHREYPICDFVVRDNFAISLGFDNRIAKFDLTARGLDKPQNFSPKPQFGPVVAWSTRLSLRSDGQLLAVAQGNSTVGLYSARSLRLITSLSGGHRSRVSCVAFYKSQGLGYDWLFAGSKDARVSRWSTTNSNSSPSPPNR